MAYAYDDNGYSDIVIYDLISNKIDNIIGEITYIDYLNHYYHASRKNHYLLSVSSEEEKLWKIHHSNQLDQILSLSSTRFACVLFIQEKMLICGGKSNMYFKVWDQNENEIKGISKINTRGISYIETAYLKIKIKIIFYTGNLNLAHILVNAMIMMKIQLKLIKVKMIKIILII